MKFTIRNMKRKSAARQKSMKYTNALYAGKRTTLNRRPLIVAATSGQMAIFHSQDQPLQSLKQLAN